MQYLEQQEWLLTNGMGGLASGTVSDARTRTYHGWLIAALKPPGERRLLLSHLEATLQVRETITKLGTNFWTDGEVAPHGYHSLQSFAIEPVPTWVWQKHDWLLKRQIFLPHVNSEASGIPQPVLPQRVLIHYTYQGRVPAKLMLRPLIADRSFHHQQLAAYGYKFNQYPHQYPHQYPYQDHWQPYNYPPHNQHDSDKYPNNQQVHFQLVAPMVGTPWLLRWSRGAYQGNNYWYRNYFYPEEQRRGLADREDLYNPGLLIIDLAPGESVTIEARLGAMDLLLPVLQEADFHQALKQEQERQRQLITQAKLPPKVGLPQLIMASDQFLVARLSTHSSTVIAGYHWFDDWGRDTLIALPGLTLTTRRFDLARSLLQTMSHYCLDGLIPNTFPQGKTEPIYNSLDASLWWIEALGLYLEASGDWEFLREQYPVVRKIYKTLAKGTQFNIRVDAIDGLLTWNEAGVAITWMDALVDGSPVTPRCGKCVEINALWYSALCWAEQWAKILDLPSQMEVYAQVSQRVKQSLQKFWNHHQGYFYDVISPEDLLDSKIRPNGIIALALHHCAFSSEQGRAALQIASDRLLTPYGLRTLDPADPSYRGSYEGNPGDRDAVYHQGTVWVWLLGSFLRAWQRFYPETKSNFDFHPLLKHLQHEAGLGSISEIFDGDPPHHPRGAIAQAWSIAEILREYSQFEN